MLPLHAVGCEDCPKGVEYIRVPLNTLLLVRGSGFHKISSSLGPLSPPNGNSVGSSVFAGLRFVTNNIQTTEHQDMRRNMQHLSSA